jgi:hypothetical protein
LPPRRARTEPSQIPRSAVSPNDRSDSGPSPKIGKARQGKVRRSIRLGRSGRSLRGSIAFKAGLTSRRRKPRPRLGQISDRCFSRRSGFFSCCLIDHLRKTLPSPSSSLSGNGTFCATHCSRAVKGRPRRRPGRPDIQMVKPQTPVVFGGRGSPQSAEYIRSKGTRVSVSRLQPLSCSVVWNRFSTPQTR